MYGGGFLLPRCRVFLPSGFLFHARIHVAIMAPSDDVVYRSHSATEGSIEKPTFKDGDKALEFLRSEAEEGEADLIDEKLLVRKIDFMIV